MAIEFPSDLIQQLQISLRKEAGIPCYNPEDVSLSDLPSLRDAIEGFDPSPPYLRCKQCHGKLLRGIQSIVCVYCGAQQHKDIPPDPINFKSTFGYPWLLQSLNLNGSEPVEAKDSNKGQNSSKDAMVLSDLLNIEMKWSDEPEKSENDIAKKVQNLNKISLNVAGVDLDNFFPETNKDSVPYTSEKHDTLERASEHTTGDSSGWEAEFQSATAGTLPVDLIPLDLFPDASPIDLSSTSEAPFRSKGEIKFQYGGVASNLEEKNPAVSQASMNDNWFQDDQWHTSNVESSTMIAQPEMKTEAIKDGKSNNLASMDDTLFPDDIWLTSSENPSDNVESMDAWQDFTSSRNVPDPFPSVSSLASNTKRSANRLAPEMNLLSESSNDQDLDFGSFMAPEIFSETGIHNGPTPLSNIQQGSYADRLEVKPGEHKSVSSTDDAFDGAMWSESADNKVERLMSEMHDLSFMLDSNLSIPQMKDDV